MSVQDNHGATPLHRCSTLGHVKVVQLMLSEENRGKIVNVTDSEGNSPLHLACEGNHTDICLMLLKAGANKTLLNKDEKLPENLCSDAETMRVVRNFAR